HAIDSTLSFSRRTATETPHQSKDSPRRKDYLRRLEVPMKTGLLFLASGAFLIAACTTGNPPAAPTSAQTGSNASLAHLGHGAATADADAATAHSAAHEDKGYIDGWFDGDDVKLYYTKSFFCDPLAPKPPDTPVPCEVGAPPDTAPRPGP